LEVKRIAHRPDVVPARERGGLDQRPGDRDRDALRALAEDLAEDERAHAEEADAEGDLFVEAGAERHDDAAEDAARARPREAERADDIRAGGAHEHGVEGAFEGDEGEARGRQGLLLAERPQRQDEERADRERQRRVHRQAVLGEAAELARHEIGGVADGEEDDAEVVGDEER